MNGAGVIVGASVLFGAMTVLVRAASETMPPLQVAFWRFLGSLVLLLAATGGRGVRPAAARHRVLVLRGLFGATAIGLWFFGIRDAGATIATLLHSTYPVWASLAAVAVLDEPFSPRVAAALAMNLLGIALVVAGGGGAGGPAALRGAACSLAAGMMAGAAVTTARHLRSSESASVVTTWFMLTGTIVTAPSLLLPAPPPTPALVASLAGIALASAGGQWLLHHGLGFTTAAQGSLAAATSIVTAALLEHWWFGTTLGGHTVTGATLMVLAVAIAFATPRRPR